MRASVIIAAHQEGALLCKTIEACLRAACEFEHEIIVADDASSDGSVDDVVARFPEVQIVRHAQRLGVSPTKDLGARRAKGDVLVFLDAHTNPEPGAIARLVEDVEATEGAAAITPAITPLCERTWRNLNSGAGHGYSLELETFDSNWLALDRLRKVDRAGRVLYESPALMGCAFAVARELYDRLWGFDRAMRLWGVEDLDFSLKCWLMGHAILHDPEAAIGHRFQEAFSNYRVSAEQVLVSQMRMAYKNFSPSTWRQWLRRCRDRHAETLSERAEGFVAAVWHQFELGRASAERERAYLSARRTRDEFSYAERFGLDWPRFGATVSAAAALPLTLHPFADPSPSPSPSCSGTLTITYNGDAGPVFICLGSTITLLAAMTGGPFPAGKPVWSFVKKPAGSAIVTPEPGTNPFTFEPDKEGEYIVQAACDNITGTFRFIAGTVTIAQCKFTGDGKTALYSDDGTYGDESGEAVPVPEYKPGQDPSPVCYVQASTIKVEATFTITPDLGADQFNWRIVGDANLVKDGMMFDFSDTIVLTGSSVVHEFTLEPGLPALVLNDTLEIYWNYICDNLEATHTIYVTYGPPSEGTVTVTRMNRVTSACNGLDDEEEIVNALWQKVAGPGTYELGADYPNPVWKILDGVAGECIAIANLFVATIAMVGVTPGDGQVVYCYVDPNGGSHESTSTDDFATRDCSWGNTGHGPAHGPTHEDQNTEEKLIWVDGSGGLNNREACYKYRPEDSEAYGYYAAGTGGDPPWPSVQAVMDACEGLGAMLKRSRKCALSLGLAIFYACSVILTARGDDEVDDNDRMERLLLTMPRASSGPRSVAHAWNKTLLKPGLMPPADADFSEIARTGEDDCDRLRMSYRVGPKRIVITQTLCIYCVEIEVQDRKRESPLRVDEVQHLARGVFLGADSLELVEGHPGRTQSGAARVTTEEADGHIPWSANFRWKSEPGRISFWMLKDDGLPRMVDCGIGLSSNAYWFSNRMPRQADGEK